MSCPKTYSKGIIVISYLNQLNHSHQHFPFFLKAQSLVLDRVTTFVSKVAKWKLYRKTLLEIVALKMS